MTHTDIWMAVYIANVHQGVLHHEAMKYADEVLTKLEKFTS